MIAHQDETGALHRAHCGECDGDAFYAEIVYLPATKVARIKQIVCVICGETTEFVPSTPRDLASA